MKNYLLIFFALILPLSCFSQSLSSPESIAYYEPGNYYLVSNAGNGTIVKYTSNGEISNLFSGLLGPKGMVVINNTLFVADFTNLVAFNLTSNTKTFTRPITGSAFLNDICSNGNELIYITDTQTNSIFKYSIPYQEITKLPLKSCIVAPNGIIYSDGKLLGVSFMTDSPIWQVDLATNNVANVRTTTLDFIDGIQLDGKGNIFVSVWVSTSESSKGEIYKIKDDFSGEFEKVIGGLSGPADFLLHNNKLVIPEMNANKITILDLNSVKEENKIEVSMNGVLQFPEEILPPYTIEIYNLLGNLVISETTDNSTYKIDLPTGTYFVMINGKSYGKILINR